jgi:hypothetical protein
MTPKLKQYLNRTILVSIPAVFKHGKCQPCMLQAVDADGLWLVSAALVDKLIGGHDATDAASQAVYVPNVQIAALILPAPSSAVPPANAGATKTGAPEAPKPTSATT